MKTEDDYKLLLERWGGWAIIVVLCALPVIRWVTLNPLQESFVNFSVAISSLGQIAGLAGFTLYAINLVLSLRKRWLEGLFGGLNRVYIAHHLTGGLALVLLMFHPVFLALQYIELSALSTLRDAAHFLIPRSLHFDVSYYEVQEAVAINNGIIAFIGMVGLLFITFFVKLPYRIWVFTHKFLGVAFIFAGLHTIMVSSDVYRDAPLKVYFILWTLIGFSAFVYRSIMGNMFIRRAPYKVAQVQTLPGNVIAIALDPVARPIDFKPGQFVFVRFLWAEEDGIINELHPFSIASEPNEEGQVRLYMKALGDYTTSLKHLKVDTVAEVEGAFGRFLPWRFRDTPQIWIAGGIGITPFLSAARSYNPQCPPVQLFYSVQTKGELLDQSALADFLPKHYKEFQFYPFVSETQKGFLTAKYIDEQAGGVKGKEIFLCGPPPMMKAMRSQLRAMGVPNSKIHSEEFSMS